jgi:hypothetical protein
MGKYIFTDIFTENHDGSLSPKRTIIVNGVTSSPGITFNPGVSFGGIDFHKYKYMNIAAEEKDGILVVKGFYKQ